MLAYLLTDIGGSTKLWETDRENMARAVFRLDQVCEDLIRECCGDLVRSRGEGDSHFGVFVRAEDAVEAAIQIQLRTRSDPELEGLELRMAIHVGSSEWWEGDYYGPVVNRCARIRQAAWPRQILVSEAVHTLVARDSGIAFKDLGTHRLKDLMQPERLYQVCHPDLPSDFPPPETLSALSHNLPAYLTSFVGRKGEIGDLTEILASNRLVTITGPGGIGKTRLTQQLAADLIQRFKEGVWFIDLAQTDRAESVVPILCRELDAGTDASEQNLLESIGTQQMLVILDNCEHLFDVCRSLASRLLLRCPELKILATSRRLLDVQGEYVYRLEGLPLPPPDELQDPMSFAGFSLFVQRARQRGTHLTVNPITVQAVADLCRKLDGLPLALEIAAGLTDVLSIAEITDSISEILQTAATEDDDDSRQRTIAVTIEWSRHLLTPEGRLLLDRVSIFPNTWTLDAAAEICFPNDPKIYTRKIVRELLSHSLVFSTRTASGDLRFGLLQTTREVVAADSPSHAGLVPAFIAFFERLVESAKTMADEGKAHALLNLEWESIAQALDFAHSDNPNRSAKMALALRGFWMSGMRLTEGKRWYRLLASCKELDPLTRVSAQIALSSIFILLGENDDALAVLLEAEETVRPLGGFELGLVIGNRAVHQDRMGRYQEAKESFEACYEIFEQCGAVREQALSLLNIGVMKLRLNEPAAECADFYHRALKLSEEADLIAMQAKAHSCLAHLELRAGKWLDSLKLNERAFGLWQQDLVIPDCVLVILDLAEAFIGLQRFDLAGSAIHIADRLEELSSSPLPSVHRSRVEASRATVRSHLSSAEWRAGQRLMKSKTASELITMTLQIIGSARQE